MQLARLVATAAVAFALPAGAEEPRGAADFAAYCAVCHGTDGRGGGPYADFLTVAPSDLTGLAAANGGTFPALEVYRLIDGRTELAAHGPRDMPIWGYEFRRLAERDGTGGETPEAAAAARIEALVGHIKGLQAE